MKLKLLLDEHISEEVAAALLRRFPGLDVKSIYSTMLKGLADPPLLEVLDHEGRTLVTRDVNSIPRHIRNRQGEGKGQGGIFYVDSKRLKQTDTKGLIRRLTEIVEKHGNEDWTGRQGWV